MQDSYRQVGPVSTASSQKVPWEPFGSPASTQSPEKVQMVWGMAVSCLTRGPFSDVAWAPDGIAPPVLHHQSSFCLLVPSQGAHRRLNRA